MTRAERVAMIARDLYRKPMPPDPEALRKMKGPGSNCEPSP